MTEVHSETETDHSGRQSAGLAHWSRVTPAMLHSIGEDGRIIFVSDAWLAKLGYNRDEVLGRLSSDFLTPESRARAIRDVVPEFFRVGRVDNVEYQMVCKDGRVIDVLVSAVLNEGHYAKGRISLAIVSDVSALKAAERLLTESEARYRGLVEDQTELVSLATPDGELRFVNHAYARLYGKRPEEMIGRSLYDYIPDHARGAVEEHLQKAFSAFGPIAGENQVVPPDGRTRWMAWTNRAIRDGQGRVVSIHSVGRDIEDRVLSDQRLKESEARYRLLADLSTDMVFQLDVDLVRRYVSPACREIVGYEPEEMIGVRPADMAHADDVARLGLAFRLLLSGTLDRHSTISRIRHRDGRWIWVEAQMRALRDPRTSKITGIIGALRDISARKAVEDQLAEANRQLESLARQDALTGLGNRRWFDEAHAREFNRAKREKTCLALIMIDVDWFKSFNDQYGHPAGDECLKQVGETIAGSVRRPADMVARYGGEEFAVLLPSTDEPGAVEIGERIRLALRARAIEHSAGLGGVITVSIGAAAIGHEDFGGSKLLLANADRALYRAKACGRNAIVRATTLLDDPSMHNSSAA